ncbi:MAG: ABC transporter permease, partial [Dehalococcoidia bacterium]
MRRRKTGGVSWLDVKLALRMLVKHPGLTLGGGLGLAVGIFISVGFYSAIMAYYFPTLPLDEGERVVALENWDTEWNGQERRILHDFFTWREELEWVEDLTAFRMMEFYLTAGDEPPELVQVAEMTAAGFRLARVPPLLGRYLLRDDEREGAPPVLVIGYHVWRTRFAGDPDILGREVRLGRVVHTVVGVMPEGFAFPQSHDYWVPLRERPSAYERRAGPVIFIAGRLAPGITMEMAQAELSAFGERTAAAFPETHERLRPMVMPYTHTFTGVRGVELWQFVLGNLMASLVLVVVALNVAVLVYARTA